MNEIIQKSLVAGMIATVIMSAVMWILPMLGMPKLSPPDMVAGMLGLPVAVGWILHFVTGISFAGMYNLIGVKRIAFLKNKIVRGAVFGLVAFVLAQVMLGVMGSIFPMEDIEGAPALIMTNSIFSHIIFGIAVAQFSN